LIAAIVLLHLSRPGGGHNFYWGQQPDLDIRRSGFNYIFLSLSSPLSLNLILPNLPQLLVSFVSIFYNSAMTSMLLAREWSGFAAHRKPLRVTSPQGQQRSTFWLQLPYRYALPLMTMMATIHWLISQAIFLVKIDVYDINGSLLSVGPDSGSTSAVGYMPLAIVLAIVLGGLLMLALIGLSFRKLHPGIPLVGSCSLAISAACGNARESDAALKPLKYGVLTNREPNEEELQFVGFSQYGVDPLVDGVRYF
jgi:hypothetical protein